MMLIIGLSVVQICFFVYLLIGRNIDTMRLIIVCQFILFVSLLVFSIGLVLYYHD